VDELRLRKHNGLEAAEQAPNADKSCTTMLDCQDRRSSDWAQLHGVYRYCAQGALLACCCALSHSKICFSRPKFWWSRASRSSLLCLRWSRRSGIQALRHSGTQALRHSSTTLQGPGETKCTRSEKMRRARLYIMLEHGRPYPPTITSTYPSKAYNPLVFPSQPMAG